MHHSHPKIDLLVAVTLAASLGCSGGAKNGADPSYDPGKLWVQPSPATLTPGATLSFRAIPEVHSEAPLIKTATWSVIEASGGIVQSVGNGETAFYTAPAAQGTRAEVARRANNRGMGISCRGRAEFDATYSQ